jgi:hypothetical protein
MRHTQVIMTSKVKTCISCAHYARDALGSEHCVRTGRVKIEVSLVDGQAREKIEFDLCKFERMGGATFRLVRRLFEGRWSCGRRGQFWTKRC